MTALAASPAAMADPLQVLIARSEARACLWREGDLDLHEAVDALQAAAVQTGLVGALGQDAVHGVMAKAFAVVRANADAEADADVSGDGVPDLDPAGYQHEEAPERGTVAKPAIDASFPDPVPETAPGFRAAASTVEALMFSLCRRGAAALSERSCQSRLAALSTAQIHTVIERLIVARPRFRAIDDELLFLLGEQLT